MNSLVPIFHLHASMFTQRRMKSNQNLSKLLFILYHTLSKDASKTGIYLCIPIYKIVYLLIARDFFYSPSSPVSPDARASIIFVIFPSIIDGIFDQDCFIL